MKNNTMTVVAALSLLAVVGAASAAPFTPGNLVTARVGAVNGPTLTNAANAVILDEYDLTGTLVQSITLPTALAGANQPFALSGTATSEGQLNLSADGSYLVLGGYGSTPGTTGVVAAAGLARVIARIDMNGNIDTSTAVTDAYTANNLRGVASADGSAFWTSGTATGTSGGVRYIASLGATTSTAVTAPGLPTNARHINIFNGQLYVSASSGNFLGLASVGIGLPTTSGTVVTALSGFPLPPVVGVSPSAYDFVVINDADFGQGPTTVAYVADDRTTAAGGVQKWVLSTGTWTLADTISSGVPFRHITRLARTGTGVALAALTGASPQRVFTIVDGGSPTIPAVALTAFTLPDVTTRLLSRGLRQIPAVVPPCFSVVANSFVPADQTGIIEGDTINLTAQVVTGSTPVSFLWLKDGLPLINGASAIGTISGATSPTLTITASTPLASGNYQARLFNDCTPNGSASRTAAVLVSPAVPACLADLAGGPNGGPDGIVDGNDFVAFINAFGASDPLADIAGGPNGGPDGIVDGNDFVAFINAFGAGC